MNKSQNLKEICESLNINEAAGKRRGATNVGMTGPNHNSRTPDGVQMKKPDWEKHVESIHGALTKHSTNGKTHYRTSAGNLVATHDESTNKSHHWDKDFNDHYTDHN